VSSEIGAQSSTNDDSFLISASLTPTLLGDDLLHSLFDVFHA